MVDETVLEFEEVLKEAGITNIKLILPLTKLKKDYGPNNMKLKLLNSYDLFLVESEIAEHAYTILGKVRGSRWDVESLTNISFNFSISSRNASAHFRSTPTRKKL